jgi:hypothetical protein
MKRTLLIALALVAVLFLAGFTQASNLQRRQAKRPARDNRTIQAKEAKPTLDEVLKSLKSHILLTARYHSDKNQYQVSMVDFDDCRFLFEIKYDSSNYNDQLYRSTSRYKSDFTYFNNSISVRKEGLGEPTLVTLSIEDNKKLVWMDHTYQIGTYRKSESAAQNTFQLGFEEKDAANQAASLMATAIKLCQTR